MHPMAISEVVKITSKGQMTLPVEIRKKLDLKKNDYVYVAGIGGIVVLKKVAELSLEDISKILQSLAKENSVTKGMLRRDIEKARDDLMRRGYVKASRTS